MSVWAVGQHAFALDCNNPGATLSCDYYRQCLEPRFKCGETGYPIGYGERYCKKFLSLNTPNNSSLSPSGVRWRNSTLKCLQIELDLGVSNNSFSSCNELTDYAFDSHPGCYTLASANICDLPISDWTTITSVPNFKDIASVKSLKQIGIVLASCSPALVANLDRIQFEKSLLVDNQNKSLKLFSARELSNLEQKELEIIEKLKFIDELIQNEK